MQKPMTAPKSKLRLLGRILSPCLCWPLCLLGVLAAVTPANAGALYGATSAGGPGELYLLNPTNGAVLQDIGPLNDSGGTNYPITGLAFHPVTRVLYGSTGNSVDATAALLVSINPQTGRVAVIGPFNAGNAGRPATMGDLAFNPATGNLYGVGTVGGPQLYSINVATGQATVIGGTGLTSTGGGGLAVSSNGVFYGTPSATRYGTYDLGTGAFTLIANPTKPAGGGAYSALAFDENGVLFGLNLGSGSPPPTHLVTIDPTTGTVTDLGASVTSMDAIAFLPPVPPSLTIVSAGSQVTLSWPESPAFQLEYEANVASAAWLTNTVPPNLVNGTNYLTLPADGTARFFRLRKP